MFHRICKPFILLASTLLLVSVASGNPAAPSDSPRVFRGPLPYEAKDADQFYGRTAVGDDCWNATVRTDSEALSDSVQVDE